MKIVTTKTTKTTVSVNVSATVRDDDEATIAVMTGSVDQGRPFGSTNLLVHNQKLFEQYKDAVKEQYKIFQESVADLGVGTTEETESEDVEI